MIGKRCIVVLTQGFVYCGIVERLDKTGIDVSQAKNLRKWGVTKGLGQLATSGPTPQTVMDHTGKVYAPISSVVHIIEVSDDISESAWK